MKAGASQLSTIKIRQATVVDAELLLDLSADTFYQAFSDQNTSSNMAAYMSSAFTKEQLEQELKAADVVFFLATANNETVGYAKLRRNTSHQGLHGYRTVEIHRLYVLKSMIGKKVGKALMETCLQQAQLEGFQVIWLGVWEHNTHAIEFYKKWGFEVFSSHVFKLGNDNQTDYLMKKHLR